MVIAVLALLVALSIPIAGRARMSAQQTACVSNLRQLYTAGMMWIGDRDGLMPRENLWMYDFAPYIGMPSSSQWTPGAPSPYRCAACQTKYPSSQPYDRTYSLNEYASSDQTASTSYQIPKLSSVRRPSELAFIMDGTSGSNGGGVYWRMVSRSNVPPSASAPLVYAHDNSINVLFVDGHVRRISSKEMEAEYNSNTVSFWRNIP